MTTSVKVKACCDGETEVHVSINAILSPGCNPSECVLQDGEEEEFFVHGDREITISEEMKQKEDTA